MARATKCLILLLLSSSLVSAQFKSTRLDDGLATTLKSDPGIVINRKNPANIIASTATDIQYTFDGGATWQKVSGFSNAFLMSDDKGNIYSFYTETSGEGEQRVQQLKCQISSDGGKIWTPAASVMNAKDQHNPGAALDTKGNIWVAWTEFDKFGSADENCQSNVMLSSSSNGRKWSKPIQISQTPGNCKDDDSAAAGAIPAIGVDGKAFITWSNQDKIFLDRSFSGGGLWLTNDIGVGPQKGGWDMKIPGYDRCSGAPVLMINQSKSPAQGSLYLVWADQRNGEDDTDVWFIRSTNFGDNWTSPMKLGDDKNNHHQYSPAMTVDQTTGYIYVVYFDRDNYDDNQTDVMLAYSSDSGSSYKHVKINEAPFKPGSPAANGKATAITAHKGVIAAVWTQVDGDQASLWTSVIKQTDLIQPPANASRKKK
ncbi:MAG TPA: sialidase family protein [Chryseolinea sp.]